MPKAPASSDPTALTDLSYEEAVKALEQLVAQLESGQMPLDQVLAAYQRGAALLASCRERLTAVEQQIEVLDNGVMKPWKPE